MNDWVIVISVKYYNVIETTDFKKKYIRNKITFLYFQEIFILLLYIYRQKKYNDQTRIV